jgi:NAD(P)-dependent dehydrogenase (short-subunit alcohol dehydrogenase family)
MRTLKEMMALSGRTALITGGGGHIGRAAAEGLAELGANLVIVDRDQKQAEQVAAEIERKHQSRAIAFPIDLANESDIRALPAKVAEEFGDLSVLIHSAAYTGATNVPGWGVPFAEQSVSAWDEAMQVNLTSAFVLAQSFAEMLRNTGHGSIILIGSIYGVAAPDFSLYEGTGMANPAAYGAGKGGLLQLGRYLSTVLAPSVRCNVLSPGGVQRGQDAAFIRRYEARTPLKRMATEEDLKGAVAYLASDLSAYVTGQQLLVDGGWTAW